MKSIFFGIAMSWLTICAARAQQPESPIQFLQEQAQAAAKAKSLKHKSHKRSYSHIRYRNNRHYSRTWPNIVDSGSKILQYASRFVGMGNVTGFRGPWCGAFMGKVAKHEGRKVPKGYLQARQWVHAGPHVSPRVGVAAVMPHHVAIVAAVHRNYVVLLGGNQNRRVGYERKSKRAIIAYVELARR